MADLARDIAATARCLAAVDARISGPAVDAPGWLGDDASAAAGQVMRLSALVRAAYDAVTPAAARLAVHAERLLETRSQVLALVHEQGIEFRQAWQRLALLPDLQLQLMIDGPGVRAIVHDVELGEASRRRRHTALLEEIEDDAAGAARVLVDSCAAVGGHGRRDEASVVVAYLAAQLPGWGDRELARQGRALAESFATVLTPERREELARDALAFAGSPAFAMAMLLAMGMEGMRDTLQKLGDGLYGPTSPLAELVAVVLGAASPAIGASDPVGVVIAAEYVPAADPDVLHDLTALGMGTVLAASAALGPRGLDKATVVGWGRQIAVRERRLRSSALDRIDPEYRDVAPADPLSEVVAVLADGRDPGAAAAFLAVPSVWDLLFSRTWEDGGVSLGQTIRTAAKVPGAAGDDLVHGGLEALGAGLEHGDVHDWPVPRATATAVSPALADALAVHVSVAGEALTAGAGELRSADAAMLRGLSYVTMDRQAAAVVEAALQRWVAVQPQPFSIPGSVPQFPAIVVPNAYLAVQEYGHELVHALDEAELEKEAENRAFLWNMTIGLAAGLAPGPWGLAAGVIADYVAMGLDLDGTWDPGPKQESTFAPEALDRRSLTGLSQEDWLYVYAMAHLAEESFEGTKQALGPLHVPTPPTTHWWDPIEGLVSVGPGDVVGVTHHGHDRVPVPPIR